ncbi:MAG: glycosyltransferase family 4 protein [Gemmatimonadales bacterium]|nr:glycosyltransferase family 4 protein [Gemmatimonadales bacterium]
MHTIGFFDDSAGPGGTTQYLVELLTALNREQFRPIVFSPRPAPWHAAMVALEAEVITGPRLQVEPRSAPVSTATLLPTRSGPRPTVGIVRRTRRALAWRLGLQRDLNTLEALFRRKPVDLLHSNNTGEEPAPIAARRAGIPRILGTLHVDPDFDLRQSRRHIRLTRACFAALDRAIAISENTASAWRAHLDLGPEDQPPFTVIPNGINLARLERRHGRAEAIARLGLPADVRIIGSVGRLDYEKGYADLIEAMPAILRAVPNAVVLHAGAGPLAASLATECQRLDITDHVRWLGFRQDVRDLLEAADLYVQPSWREAQGLAVLEAGAMGVPVIATQVGGMVESLANGDAGTIIPPMNPPALADAVIGVLLDPAPALAKAAVLQTRIQTHYTDQLMVTETMNLYQKLLHTEPRR